MYRAVRREFRARPSLPPHSVSLELAPDPMTTSCSEALATAKKLCRTLASAPLPQARAQSIFSELTRANGWAPGHRQKIAAFGLWLASRPPPSALKSKCDELLEAIS